MQYGKAIRLARTARGLNQKDLAEKLGVTASFVSLLESDARKPSVDTLQDISQALQFPMYLLMLMASEEQDLRGISVAQARTLSKELLDVIMLTEKGTKDEGA